MIIQQVEILKWNKRSRYRIRHKKFIDIVVKLIVNVGRSVWLIIPQKIGQ